ncbi:MAG: preprotein translocase subunit SecE [Cytophagales bacterium]|nr:preprotein translocase subunit SecE [Cytophagales bacterium]MDW8383740.1 preprotein translocase subunit SecE [Flammeovirgaceae bacterium]
MLQKIKDYLKDSYTEIVTNVTWSSLPELYQSATLVIIATFIFALLIGLMDYVFNLGLGAFYKSF